MTSSIARLGGIAASRDRVGDSEWGKRMLRRRGYVTQQRDYPTLSKGWRENGLRKARGLPMLPLPAVEGGKRAARPESQITVERGGAPDGEPDGG
jgi:hypothetical protein